MSKTSGSPSERDPVKNQRRSSPDDGKVGIFVHSCEHVFEHTEFLIYVINVDSPAVDGEYTQVIKPHIRVPAANGWAACVLHSALYLFAGCMSPYTVKDAEKKAMKFPIGDHPKPRLVGRKYACPLPSMRYPKSNPKAVPTPDGNKILVFQPFIDRSYPEFAIELYDPLTGIWTEFPGFPLPRIPEDEFGSPSDLLVISGCTFISDSVFCIDTEDGTFNLNIETKLWEFSSFNFCYYIDDYCAPIGNTDYCLLPEAVHDRVKYLYYSLPITENEKRRPYFEGIGYPTRSSAVVHGNGNGNDGDKVYRICTGEFEVGLPHAEPRFNPCILIDVCRADLNNMDITLIKSLKIKLKLYRTILISSVLIPIC